MGSAERRVADFVISDPTIVRFFRRFGFDGFNEFKVRPAQDLVPSAPFEYEGIRSHDSVSEVVRKTCYNSINAIQRSLLDFKPAEIETATVALLEAKWIGIMATGMSEIAALDAEHKFTRLGLRCSAVVRTSRQLAVGNDARAGGVFLVFSQSGATRRLAEGRRRWDDHHRGDSARQSPGPGFDPCDRHKTL